MIKKIAKKLSKKSTAKKAAKPKAASTSKTKPKATSTGKKTAAARKRTTRKMRPEEIFALIEKTAYELYESRGYSHGDDQNDWFEAEKIVLAKVKK